MYREGSAHPSRISYDWRINMKPKEKLLIAGGDMRQIYCAARLAERYDAAIIGFSEGVIPPGLKLRRAELTEKAEYDYAVLPVPAMNGDTLNMPCSEEKISPEQIREMLKPGGRAFAGKPNDELKRIFSDAELCDYMEREDLSLLNAIPTAEGAVMLALEELPVTLSGAKALVVGCGRIGTALIGILKGFGADVTAAVRSARGAAKARILGAKPCCLSEMESDFDVVFNTVPAMIFDRPALEKMPPGVLIIDLASKPGGVDFEAAAELGVKVIWALGLPGKCAPITAGEMIADTISAILSERSGRDG